MINQKIRNKYFVYLRPKLNIENKNRNKIYSILVNELNPLSYFDYFSLDLIKTIIIIKYFIKENRVKKIIDFSLYKNNSLQITNLNLLISKTINNSLVKFKNPIITTEIFFYTCLENKINIHYNKIFNIQIIKYKLLQKIYIDNLNLKKVNRNIQFFTILFKIQIPTLQFKKLYFNNNLNLVIFVFRNLLLNEIKISKFKLENNKKITNLIFLTNKRIY